jgi:hypothetical protein
MPVSGHLNQSAFEIVIDLAFHLALNLMQNLFWIGHEQLLRGNF